MDRHANRLFLLLLFALLLAFPAGVMLWSHQETVAYYENRSLAERPALTGETLWDGSFGTEMESWYSDHAPGRTTLLKLDTALQMYALRRPVVNGIVTGGEVLLPFLDYDEYTETDYAGPAQSIAEKYGKLNAYIAANGGTLLFVGFPEQRVYFEDQFPADFNSHAAEAETADRLFKAVMTDQNVSFLDMTAVYEALGHPADHYSAVDHHYNGRGAYAAYRAILAQLNAGGLQLPVLDESDMDFQELPNPFLGSRNRKLYNLWSKADRAVVPAQKEPVPFTRFDNGAPSSKPLFVLPANDTLPTSYNLYMGGDFGETVLQTNRPELPNVLIVGDSFTNALETLLYAAFNETRILDLRHYTETSLKDYIAAYQPDVVLCVSNDTFYYTTTGNGAVWED